MRLHRSFLCGRELEDYGFDVIVCFSSLLTIAIFIWQEITKNHTTGQIKRLELQAALLIDYLKEKEL